MKRLLTLLLSALLALVMCFSVIACGNKTDKDNTDPNAPGINTPGEGDGEEDGEDDGNSVVPPEVASKAASAVRKLYEADSYVASLEIGLNSKLEDATSYEYSVEKRGSKFAFTKAGKTTSYIVDTETGYLYAGDAQSGYVAMPAVPADTLGYYAYVLKQSAESYEPATGETGADQQPAPAMPDVTVGYDKSTKTLTVAIDAAKYVNDSLAPLYDAYKKNKTIRVLLDEYVKSNTNKLYSFTMLYETLFLLAKTNEDATFDQANTALKALDPDLDLYELLGETVEMDDEARAKLATRTVGEIISGSYDYISALIANPPTTGFDVRSIAQGLLTAALFNETETSPEKTEQIKASLDLSLSTSIKDLVNSALAENPEALAIIASGVTFKTLKSDITLKFDADDNIETLTAACELEHSYTGDTDGFVFLSDNEYKLDVVLGVSEYSDAHTDFEGEIASVTGDARAALIYGDITTDVTVYIETAGENIPSVASVGYAYDDNDAHVAPANVVTIDNASSSVVIDKEFINQAVGGASGASVRMIVTFADGTELYVVYAGVDDVKDVTTEIVMNLMQIFG